MTIELTPEEVETLHSILANHLGDVRMEIADTDNSRFKDGLRLHKRHLESVLAKVAAVAGQA